MLEAVIGLLSSGGLGAIVGLVGAIFTKKIEAQAQRDKLEHERSMTELRVKELEVEHQHALDLAEKQIEIAEAEAQIQRDVAEMNAFTESQKAQSVRYGSWVDSVRGLMRPLITTTLMIAFIVLVFVVWTRVGGLNALTGEQINALFTELLRAVIFLTITSVTWWFGSRPTEWRKMNNG